MMSNNGKPLKGDALLRLHRKELVIEGKEWWQ